MNTENQNIDDNNPEKGSGEVFLFKNKDVTDNNSEKNDSEMSIRMKNGDFVSDPQLVSHEPITPMPSPINSQHSSNIQRSIYNPCMADTHSRIFGDSDDTIPQASPRRTSTVTFKGNSSDNPESETIEKAHFYGKKADGNPLTGEGYDTDKSYHHGKMPPGGPSTPLW